MRLLMLIIMMSGTTIFGWIDVNVLHNLTGLSVSNITYIMGELDYIECEAEREWRQYYPVFSRLIKQYNLEIGCEIGVSTGGHSHYILKNTNVKKLYSIDPWCKNPFLGLESNEMYDVLYYRVKYRLGAFDNRSEVIRDYSKNAVSLFRNNSLDFLFVDGDHSYKGVMLDLNLWYDKVRPGGIIGGDDYTTGWEGVARAVNEFFGNKKLVVNQDKEQSRVWWVIKPYNILFRSK